MVTNKHPYWRPFPLTFSIMNIIERREGILLEDDLIRLLESDVGEFSKRELNQALMKLEIEGLVLVQTIKKNQRVIKRVQKGKTYLTVGED